MSEETAAVADTDDEFDLDSFIDGDGDPEDVAAPSAPAAAPAPEPAAQAPAPVAPPVPDPTAVAALNALKAEWSRALEAKYPLANFDSIGIAGNLDADSRARFEAEAKAQHDKNEAQMVALGYQRVDPEARAAAEETEDRRQAEAWGKPVSGDVPNSDSELAKDINESMSVGVKETIDTLGTKAGLFEFFKRK